MTGGTLGFRPGKCQKWGPDTPEALRETGDPGKPDRGPRDLDNREKRLFLSRGGALLSRADPILDKSGFSKVAEEFGIAKRSYSTTYIEL